MTKSPTNNYAIDLHHPPSLRVFFATEMWERYGFYVVQTLLALYLALHFKWQDQRVYALVGSFTALTYLSPLVGGWIADHLIGQKRAILLGSMTLACSYFALSLTTSDYGLPIALAGVAVGTGLIKPNISSLLGNSYPENAPCRESGFIIFYMGITTGIILGTTLPSYLNQHFGWSTAFLSASIGLIFAVFVFSFGIYRYQIQDYHPYTFKFKNIALAISMLLILWLGAFYVLHYPKIADILFISVIVLSSIYITYCVKIETKAQARYTLTIGLLCIISIIFWAFYFQMFLSLTLFIARVVNPTLFGITFPPPFYVGIQSIGMIIIGLILARDRRILTKSQQGLRTGNKFSLSMIIMTLAYALITVVSKNSATSTLISPLYILPAYLLISLAELLLSPVGLSAITVLASRTKVSTMMGIFFVSLGSGAFLSGKLANLTAIPNDELSLDMLEKHYAMAFSNLLLILTIATTLCLIINYIIKRLMQE